MSVSDMVSQYGLEFAGTSASLIYLYYSIREKVWLWPWGLLASVISSLIFFQAALYADMGLQAYYIFISCYGWWYWVNGRSKSQIEVPIKLLNTRLIFKLSIVGVLLFLAILLALLKVPGIIEIASSDMPYWDAFTTAASIVATWMLARKYLHHWLLWIVIDLVSMVMYAYKGLYFYSFLFIVYTIGAVIGYLKWKQILHKDVEA